MMVKTYAQAAAAAALAPGDPLTQPLAEARRAQNAYLESLVRSPRPVGGIVNRTVPGPHGDVPVRFTFPAGRTRSPLVVHVRGGGWWSGTLDASTALVNQIAEAGDCAVCSIDYRCAPEHRYPVQLEELLAVLAWLDADPPAEVRQPSRPILFGESAGASLVLAAAMRRRDHGLPLPLAIVQFYSNALGPPREARPMTRWIWNGYLPSQAAAEDPGAVPLRGDFRGLPPMWLGVGEQDHLLADTLALAARCAAEGIPHVLARYPDLPHGFLQFVSTLEPARDALADAARYIRQRFDGQRPAGAA